MNFTFLQLFVGCLGNNVSDLRGRLGNSNNIYLRKFQNFKKDTNKSSGCCFFTDKAVFFYVDELIDGNKVESNGWNL